MVTIRFVLLGNGVLLEKMSGAAGIGDGVDEGGEGGTYEDDKLVSFNLVLVKVFT